MLSRAIGGLLPSAVAIALSPIPVVAVVLVLDTRRARSNGPMFAVGWIAGLVAVSVLVLLLAHGASSPDSGAASGVRWGSLAVGVLFLVMALAQLRKRPKRGEPPEMPKWMASVDGFTPSRSIVLGALLSGANPKNLALTATAAAAIAQEGLSAGGDAVAVAVLVAIGSLTVAGAVGMFLVAPRASAAPLQAVKVFMSDHNAVIMFVVLLVLGVKLIGQGVAG